MVLIDRETTAKNTNPKRQRGKNFTPKERRNLFASLALRVNIRTVCATSKAICDATSQCRSRETVGCLCVSGYTPVLCYPCIDGWPGLESDSSKPRGFLRSAQSNPGHPIHRSSSDNARGTCRGSVSQRTL